MQEDNKSYGRIIEMDGTIWFDEWNPKGNFFSVEYNLGKYVDNDSFKYVTEELEKDASLQILPKSIISSLETLEAVSKAMYDDSSDPKDSFRIWV